MRQFADLLLSLLNLAVVLALTVLCVGAGTFGGCVAGAVLGHDGPGLGL